MRFTVHQAAFVLLLPVAGGCGADSPTTYSPGPSPTDGLWTVSASPPAILRLAPTQLGVSGSRVPATTVTTPSAGLSTLVGIAFDPTGAMWVTSQDDSLLLGFASPILGMSGSTAATTVIGSAGRSLSAPTGLAFDREHRLWVANHASGTLVRFDPVQLATSGAPVPAVVLSGLGHPGGIAFDAAGSLWVSDNQASTIAQYLPAQLAASGSPTPAVILSANGNSLEGPSGLALDAFGNLWVANVGNATVAAFSPAQRNTTGAPSPHIVLSATAGSLSIPVGLAFDAGGNLWVMNGGGVIEQFASMALGATGAPPPSVSLTLDGHVLFWSLAFWPVPADLPLN